MKSLGGSIFYHAHNIRTLFCALKYVYDITADERRPYCGIALTNTQTHIAIFMHMSQMLYIQLIS